MSLGERISTIRKETGLSQEAFGNELNVTRQTVSKWELNQAYPEMNKLIEITKKYNVSIEWLLGIREEKNNTQDLSEQQLEIVERILNQYLDKKEKRQYLKYVNIVLMTLIMIITFSWATKLSNSMNQLYSHVDHLVNNTRHEIEYLENNIDNLENNIKEYIDYQNSPLLTSIVELNDYDYKSNTASLHVEIIPKEYNKDLKIQVLIDNGKTKKKVDLIENDNHIFEIDTKIEIEENIIIYSIYKTDNIEKQEILKEYANILTSTEYRYEHYLSQYYQKVATFDMYLNSKNEQILQCEPKYLNIYIFADDEFVRKEKFIPKKAEYDDFKIQYSIDIQELFGESQKDTHNVKLYTVLTDEFDRTYAIGYDEYQYNRKVNKFSDLYSNIDNYIGFDWQNYD